MARVIQNRQRRLRLNWRAMALWAEALIEAAGFQDEEVGIGVVTGRGIQRLNKLYRDDDRLTDVLAFSFEDAILPEEIPKAKGDVVVSGDATLEQAERYGHTPETEFKILLSHGVAHLLGYEDGSPEERRRMRRVERKLRRGADGIVERDSQL